MCRTCSFTCRRDPERQAHRLVLLPAARCFKISRCARSATSCSRRATCPAVRQQQVASLTAMPVTHHLAARARRIASIRRPGPCPSAGTAHAGAERAAEIVLRVAHRQHTTACRCPRRGCGSAVVPVDRCMRRSMIARSGRSSRSRRTASSALPVLPRTFMPARASSSSDSLVCTGRVVDQDETDGCSLMGMPRRGASVMGKVSSSRVPACPVAAISAVRQDGAPLAHDRDAVVAAAVGESSCAASPTHLLDDDDVVAAAACERQRACVARACREMLASASCTM